MPLRKVLSLLLSVSLLPIGLPAQSAQSAQPKVTITKAPPETPEQYAARKLALQEMLQRLTTTGRIMQVVAHPDDEDGAMLTLESRVKGNTAMLFTFTRGEGGQNAQGAVFFDELGILRTLELLASDKEYGAEERFSHVADFGFSKTATESFAKWGGEDVPLEDLVRQVREFQPDVLVARFSGTPRDGHGHHQASALMTVKAFHDAADAKRFPEHELQAWQPLKLYTGLAGDAAAVVPDEDQPSALLGGKTPAQIALEGLRFQKSQGLGNVEHRGPRPKIYSSYKLVAAANNVPKHEHESGFFEGVDTSLQGLPSRFPAEAKRFSNLKEDLALVADLVSQAQAAAAGSTDAAIEPLIRINGLLRKLKLPTEVDLARSTPDPLSLRLAEKLLQANQALQLAAGFSVSVEGAEDHAKHGFLIQGQKSNFDMRLLDEGSHEIHLETAGMHTPYARELPKNLLAGQVDDVPFTVAVDEQTPIVRPSFHRDFPARDTTYVVDNAYLFARSALPKGMSCSVPWGIGSAEGITWKKTDFFVAPPISISVSPDVLLRRGKQAHDAELNVMVQNNSVHTERGTSTLRLPAGWSSVPAKGVLSVPAGAASGASFMVHWPQQSTGLRAEITASFTSEGKTYSENYHLVSRPDLPDAFPYYAPAQTTISLIDADIPEQHNIGYIMGAGDTIPDDLTSLGFTVHLLTAEDLASGDLKQYDTIVTGIRAYATRADLRDHNQRLLEYVKSGGTFVVQYEQDYSAFNLGSKDGGHYTPFPATMGRERVSQEEQPVKILDPESSILRYPNRITNADFDHWIQERGLYFMKEWSPDYTPLLSMNDAGEAPLEGGLLVAHYGKGTYIYTGLSFYRELPNGVPGAARLFINLLAAGHNPADQPVRNARK